MTTRTTHRLRISCRCPVDEQIDDEYEVEVELLGDRVLDLARFLGNVDDVTAGAKYQEDVTRAIAGWLEEEGYMRATVTTRGRHFGVETTCCCS